MPRQCHRSPRHPSGSVRSRIHRTRCARRTRADRPSSERDAPHEIAISVATRAASRLEAVDAYLIDAVRTPFGKHRGGLSGIRTDDLAALPIVELTKRIPALDPGRIDDV